MRKDANLSDEELEKLWETDAKGALYEWSYRIFETPSAMDDPASFVLYLFEKFKKTIDRRLLGFSDFQNFSNLTEAFDNGSVTLIRWTDFVRSMAGAEPRKETQLVPRTDPAVMRHLATVFSNVLKKDK